MDVFYFINSRDIREHLKKIGYQFSTLETAFLVGHSRIATMQERFDAWEEIIATMPDCAPQKPQKTTSESSFHALLREYIELQKKKLELFYSSEDAVYQYALARAPSEPSLCADRINSKAICPDAASCIRACVEGWKEAETEGGAIVLGGEIIKRWLYRPESEKEIRMGVNKNGELLSCLYSYGIPCDEHQTEIDRLLEDMWFDFSTPFERGDILIDVCNPRNPFVLDDMISWDTQRMLESGFSQKAAKGRDAYRERVKNGGQWSDMYYYAWYYGTYSSGLFCETGMNYMDLEYCRDSLVGGYRTLKAVSCFLKEWVNEGSMGIDLLCNAFSMIQQEEQYKKFRDGITGTYYTDEALRDYGIPRRKSKRE